MTKEQYHLRAILSVIKYIEREDLINDNHSARELSSLIAIIGNNTYEGLGMNIPKPK